MPVVVALMAKVPGYIEAISRACAAYEVDLMCAGCFDIFT